MSLALTGLAILSVGVNDATNGQTFSGSKTECGRHVHTLVVRSRSWNALQLQLTNITTPISRSVSPCAAALTVLLCPLPVAAAIRVVRLIVHRSI